MQISYRNIVSLVLTVSALSAACGAQGESASTAGSDVLTAEQEATIAADTVTYSDEAAELASIEADAASSAADAGLPSLKVQDGCYYNCYIDYRTLYQNRGGQIFYKSNHHYVRGCTNIMRCARG